MPIDKSDILLTKELIKQIDLIVKRFESKVVSCDANRIMTLSLETSEFIKQAEPMIADMRIKDPKDKEVLEMAVNFDAIKNRYSSALLDFEKNCICTRKEKVSDKKGEKYSEYDNAISPHVDSIKKQILSASTGYISMKLVDIAKLMGPEFEKRHGTSIYWGLKFVLFQKGIVVSTGRDKDGNLLLTMRFKTAGDTLPVSLEKYKS